MFTFPQSMTPALKAHMDNQLSLLNDMSKKVFETVQRINKLNIQVAQTLTEESIMGTQQVLDANDLYEAIAVLAAQAPPAAEKIRAYQQHLTNIAAGTQVELVEAAEAHVPEAARTASEETQKATQRQKAAMEKATRPINERGDGRDQSARRGA